MWFLEFLRDFIAVPAIVVGLFTMIGSLIQKQKASNVTISTFKVIVGFLIMGGGAGLLVTSLEAFQPVFESTYGLSGIIPNNDGLAGAITAALPSISSLASVIMIVAMLLNIVLALSSRLKYIFLSGHVLYYMSLMLAIIMYVSNMDFENSVADYAIAVISGSALLSVYMVVSPAINQRYMRQITGTNEIAIGHTGGFGYALSGFIGETIAKHKKGKIISTEEIKFPSSLNFLRNSMVSISITILLFYIIAFIPGGILYEINPDKLSAEAISVLESPNWVVTMIVSAFTFTAGIEIILMGVRLFVGELVPMFKGISEKLIKNAKAAVDCPVVFPYAPNAVLIGFLASFVGGLIGMFITIGLNIGSVLAAVILPGLVPHFFLGATSGVFGNVKGGIWGAIIGPMLVGLIITFVPAIFIWGGWIPYSSPELEAMTIAAGTDSAAIESMNWGDTDFIIGIIPGLLGLVSKYLILVFSVFVYLGFVTDGVIFKFRNKDKNASSKSKSVNAK